MKKEENKINFDMSTLTLSELIKVYENITAFIAFLNEKRIVPVKKEEQDE